MRNLSSYKIKNYDKTSLSVTMLALCFYIFLVIERPWESIRYLEGIPVERPFAILMIIIALAAGKFKVVESPTNKWVYGLLLLHFVLAPFAFHTGFAIEQGFEYAKIVVLYILMLSVVDDERALKLLIVVYVGSTFIYMLHSLWEYYNGRHVYRMGITRMLGVGSHMSDPNAFGSTIVLSVPFVYALLKSELSKKIRYIYYVHICLVVICVVFTGSRTATVALALLFLLWAVMQKGKKKVILLSIVMVAGSLVWFNMPADKQERIRTLWDDDAGPANAHSSAAGRMVGWLVSWEMFKSEPLTGVGTGKNNFIGYRLNHRIDQRINPYVDEGSPTQSHVLYGQVLAEQGIFGAVMFAGLIFSIVRTSVVARKNILSSFQPSKFMLLLSAAIFFALILLLFLGFGGHNFYRPLWLWLAAWSGIMFKLTQPKKRKSLRGGEYG